MNSNIIKFTKIIFYQNLPYEKFLIWIEQKFKKIIKEKLFEKAFEFLNELKDKHTKTEKLNKYECQKYLISQDLSITEKKLLFSLRTRMFNVKTNYRKKISQSDVADTPCLKH